MMMMMMINTRHPEVLASSQIRSQRNVLQSCSFLAWSCVTPKILNYLGERTVLALDEESRVMCRSSRIKLFFLFYKQNTLTTLADCVTLRSQYCSSLKGHSLSVFIQGSINLGERFLRTDKAHVKNHTDLNLCKGVHICLREPLYKMTLYEVTKFSVLRLVNESEEPVTHFITRKERHGNTHTKRGSSENNRMKYPMVTLVTTPPPPTKNKSWRHGGKGTVRA